MGLVLRLSRWAAIIALSLFQGSLQATAANCSDAVVLDSQQAINTFSSRYQGCSSIGALRIEEAVDGDIRSLAGLVQLTAVEGALQVFNNSALQTVDGLDNLSSVGAQLDLYRNARLTSISGLQNVTTVGGFLDISYSSYLPHVDALSKVASVGTRLRLFHL